MFFNWSCLNQTIKLASMKKMATIEDAPLEDDAYVLRDDTPSMSFYDASLTTPETTTTQAPSAETTAGNESHPKQYSRSTTAPTDQHRFQLLICHNCRLLWDVEQASRSGGSDPKMSLGAFGPSSKNFHHRSMQHRLCYNSRSFSVMPSTVAIAYKRLASMFELNWTVLEPLTACVGSTHPIVAAAYEENSSNRVRSNWLLCGETVRPAIASTIRVLRHHQIREDEYSTQRNNTCHFRPMNRSRRRGGGTEEREEESSDGCSSSRSSGSSTFSSYSTARHPERRTQSSPKGSSCMRSKPNAHPPRAVSTSSMVHMLMGGGNRSSSSVVLACSSDGLSPSRSVSFSEHPSENISSPLSSHPISNESLSFSEPSWIPATTSTLPIVTAAQRAAAPIEPQRTNTVERPQEHISNQRVWCEAPAYMSFYLAPFRMQSQRCRVSPCVPKFDVSRVSTECAIHGTDQTPQPSSSPEKTAERRLRMHVAVSDQSQSCPVMSHRKPGAPTTEITSAVSKRDGTLHVPNTASCRDGMAAASTEPSTLSEQPPLQPVPTKNAVRSVTTIFFESRVLLEPSLIEPVTVEATPASESPSTHEAPDPYCYALTLPKYAPESPIAASPAHAKRKQRRKLDTAFSDASQKNSELLQRYAEKQVEVLQLHGCLCPEDDFCVVFVRLPVYVRRHLQFPITQRRRLLCRTRPTTASCTEMKIVRSLPRAPGLKRIIETEDSMVSSDSALFQNKDSAVVSQGVGRRCVPPDWPLRSSSAVVPSDHYRGVVMGDVGRMILRDDDDDDDGDGGDAFERLVRTKRDSLPLYIRTSRLQQQHLLGEIYESSMCFKAKVPLVDEVDRSMLTRVDSGTYAKRSGEETFQASEGKPLKPCLSLKTRNRETDNNRDFNKVALIVLFGGKDMLSLDWLPFLSHFFNFAVGARSNSRVNHQDQNSSSPWQARDGTKTTTTRHKLKDRFVEPLIRMPAEIFAGTTGEVLSSEFRPQDTVSGEGIPSSQQAAARGDGASVDNATADSKRCNLKMCGIGISCAIKCAFLLFDYPGSGASAAPPSVAAILESAVKSIDAAIGRLIEQVNPMAIDIRIVGYSLGAAIAISVADILAQAMIRQASLKRDGVFSCPLLDSDETQRGRSGSHGLVIRLPSTVQFDITRLVLLAPFTSVADWMASFLRVPELLRQFTGSLFEGFVESGISWDNMISLSRLCATINSERSIFKGFQLSVLHGSSDTTIPLSMGIKVATQAHHMLYPEMSNGMFRRPSVKRTETSVTSSSCRSVSPDRQAYDENTIAKHRPISSTALKRSSSISSLVLKSFRLEDTPRVEQGQTNIDGDHREKRLATKSLNEDVFRKAFYGVKSETRQTEAKSVKENGTRHQSERKPPETGKRSPRVRPEPQMLRYVYSIDCEQKSSRHHSGFLDADGLRPSRLRSLSNGTSVWNSPDAEDDRKDGSNASPSVRFIELDCDHQSILTNPVQQRTIFLCFLSDWMTCAMDDDA